MFDYEPNLQSTFGWHFIAVNFRWFPISFQLFSSWWSTSHCLEHDCTLTFVSAKQKDIVENSSLAARETEKCGRGFAVRHDPIVLPTIATSEGPGATVRFERIKPPW